MRLPIDPRLPDSSNRDRERLMQLRLTELFRQTNQQVNDISEGKLIGRHFNGTAAPTTGTYAQGDILWHSTPTEAGVALSKYVIIGFICTVAGTPGTWLQMRTLTGN